MKWLTLSVILLPVVAYPCTLLEERYGVNSKQLDVMYTSYLWGKDAGIGYSLAAIAFKESSAGKEQFLYNPDDPSAGYYGVRLDHVTKKLGLPYTTDTRVVAKRLLIDHPTIAAGFAASTLEWWLERHRGDWYKAWRSYNGGYYWRSSRPQIRERSKQYADDIKALVRTMQHCRWDA